MEISILTLFCKTVELCPFYCADDLFLIKALLQGMAPIEEFLGSRLFVLDEKKLDITEAGKIFYPYAREIIKNMEEARKAISSIDKGEAVLMVGTCTGSGNSFMIAALGEYRKIHPETKLILRIDTSAAIIEKVQNGVFELGITGYKFDYGKLDYQEILEDELLVIGPPEHVFAERKTIGIKEILDEPFILEQEGSGSRESLVEELGQNAIKFSDLKVAMEVGLHESVKSAVISGLGISILPWLSVEKDVKSGKIAAIRIKESILRRKFYLATRKGVSLSPTAQSFKIFLNKWMQKHSG